LIVEDEVEICEILSQNLEILFGFEVVCANEGEAGFDKFKESQFDLVITDIRMPKKNGLQLYHAIRDINKTVPVMMITGFADYLHTELLAMGVSSVHTKPLELKELNDKIELLLQVKPLS